VSATASGKPPISQDLAPPAPSGPSTVHWTILVANLRTVLDATIVANGFEQSGVTATVTAAADAHLLPGETVSVMLRLDARCAGRTCPADQTCSLGDCVPRPVFGNADGGTTSCTSGMHSCEGSCVDDTSPDHCGTLCTPCPKGFACAAGVCKTSCASSDDCHPDYFCDATNAACHSDVVSVACGSDHTCAALKDGRVMCWGNNSAGQLGLGTTEDTLGPVEVPGITSAILVKANEYSTCVIRREGTASCWGNYFNNESETFLASRSPILVTTGEGGLTNIRLLELGFNDGCAVATSGTYCWGQNSSGELGLNATQNVYPATLLISAGVPSLLGMGFGYQVAAYGATSVCPWDSGQPEPQGQCTDLGIKIAQFAVGGYTNCVRLQDGNVVCWGINNVGQVGPNSTASTVDLPGVRVPGPRAADIAAGIDYACTIPTDDARTMVCWGHTSAALRVIAPDLAPGLQMAKLGAGTKAYSICAILTDGSLLCWDAFGIPLAVRADW
jgi:Regulator of chromosome condensation (RCC1) repeat